MTDIVRYSSMHQQAVLELIVSIQRGEFGFDIDADDQPDLLEIQTFYQSGAGDFWLALDGQVVVGTTAHDATFTRPFGEWRSSSEPGVDTTDDSARRAEPLDSSE